MIHAYGPTETTIFATNYQFIRESETIDGIQVVPIGRPLSTHIVYVLDERHHLVPIGFPGELYIGGPCCQCHYLGDSVESEQRFVNLPKYGKVYRTGDIVRWLPSHQLSFMGRNDQQIKLYGHRIDLLEIENVIRYIKGVLDVVVMVRSDHLVCYLSLLPLTDHVTIESMVRSQVSR